MLVLLIPRLFRRLLLELPLPSQPPEGAGWIEAFQRWRAMVRTDPIA